MSEADLIHPIASRRTKLGNPGPLSVLSFWPCFVSALNSFFDSGLFSFASTTLILSLYNVHARGIAVPNVVVGMALFCGGLAQLLAGMWEFATGNTFGATGMSFPLLLFLFIIISRLSNSVHLLRCFLALLCNPLDSWLWYW
jgi:succinate-acetate transporter protein